MITDDEVDRIIQVADPAGSVDDGHLRYLSVLIDWHLGNSVPVALEDAGVVEPDTSDLDSAGHLKKLALVALAAAAVALALIAVTTPDGSEDERAITGSAPIETPGAIDGAIATARGFVEAYIAFDTERALGYLDQEALVAHWGSPETFRLTMSLLQAQQTEMQVRRCLHSETSPAGIEVRCTVEAEIMRHDLYLRRATTYWHLRLRANRIVSLREIAPVHTDPRLWAEFRGWVEREHPDHASAMFHADGSVVVSAESVKLWQPDVVEFIATHTSATFGLPEPGAQPSLPVDGKLVASGESGRPATWWYLYDDGRLIWSSYDAYWTGWLEQRLSPAGVDRVLEEITSTGLFDAQAPPSGSEPHFELPGQRGRISLSAEAEIADVYRAQGQEWVTRFDQLYDELLHLESWLPEDAWVVRGARPYVPSTIAVCVDGLADKKATGLADLPEDAKAVLAGARFFTHLDAGDGVPGYASGPWGCFDVSGDQALAVAAALVDVEADHGIAAQPWFELESSTSTPGRIGIDFWARLPHGELALTGG